MHRGTIAVALGMIIVAGCGRQSQAEAQSIPSTTNAADSANVPVTSHPDAGDASTKPQPASADFGDPLAGLTGDELALFEDGKVSFQEGEEVDEGVGPVFNEVSCVACHLGPGVGGSNGRLETRFGRHNGDGSFDPLTAEGGSLLQDHGIGAVNGFVFAAETVPPDAN